MSVDPNDRGTGTFVDLPLLPLKDIVVFPHMIVPVFINEDLCINAVDEALAGQRKIFLSAFKTQGGEEAPGLESRLDPPFDVYDTGTVCSIMRTRKLPDGRVKVLVQGLYKARIQSLLRQDPAPLVQLQTVRETLSLDATPEVEALVRVVRESLERVVSLGKVLSPDILMVLEDVKDPGRLADLVASNLGLKVEEAQKILAIFDPGERLHRVHSYLSREIEVFQMQVKIQSQAREEIGKLQKEHYLREQIRALKSELGDIDPRDEIDDLWKQLETVALPTEAREELARHLRRLERMHQDTSEASLTRTYIETALSLPWGAFSDDNLVLKEVASILDEDHYGLGQVKDRIIEYLAVKKLNPAAKSPILCFVGPPGVGKTSLGRSIARALGRSFARISLGGVRDEADIRGHRKTYVGAFPGRIIQSMRQAKTANPVIMLDEIDKLGADHRGDPAAALLETLDPEQNHQFVDHYIGIPFDLSKVMFLANANTLDPIPRPLHDRLEIIEVAGYSEHEKREIASRFLIPKQVRESGLSHDQVSVSRSALACIIRDYTRESGLRSLEKSIASVCRKIARGVAEAAPSDASERYVVTPAKVRKYLGAARFMNDGVHGRGQVGVALGLAYTTYGGEVLVLETNLTPGSGKLRLTGQLGEVMQESAQAALSFVRSQLAGLLPEGVTGLEHDIHVHVAQGAVPKDGPSAGVALVTSILSALMDRPVRGEVCMTGEITLHGKVLPVGGLREKLLAAGREGLTTVLLPEGNRQVVETLPGHVTRKLEIQYASDFKTLIPTLFPGAEGLHALPAAETEAGSLAS